MLETNLSTENLTKKSDRGLDKNIIFSVGILILVIAAFATLWFIKSNLSAKVQAIHDQSQEKYNVFLAGNGSEVVDFKNRSDYAEKLLASDVSMNDFLEKVEKSILPSVILNSFEYDKKGKFIKISCGGDNFNTVAKQVLSFKQSGDFTDVILGESTYNSKENKMTFSINLTIK
jgi:hypothetical protein